MFEGTSQSHLHIRNVGKKEPATRFRSQSTLMFYCRPTMNKGPLDSNHRVFVTPWWDFFPGASDRMIKIRSHQIKASSRWFEELTAIIWRSKKKQRKWTSIKQFFNFFFFVLPGSAESNSSCRSLSLSTSSNHFIACVCVFVSNYRRI